MKEIFLSGVYDPVILVLHDIEKKSIYYIIFVMNK